MTTSRRKFLHSGVGLAAGAALPFAVGGCAVHARPVASSTQVSEGVYRSRIGALNMTAVSDGFAQPPLTDGFVRNATLEQVRQALREANLPDDRITIPFTAVLVETSGRRLLFDSGNGQFGAPTSGRVAANLRAAGVAPESIDAVLISHFHGDHINGLRNRDGTLVYPNARIHVPAAEWNFWMDDAKMAAAPDAMKGAFQGVRRVFEPMAQQVQRFEPDSAVLSGVRSMAAYGHTPGHTIFSLESEGQTWTYLGDVTNIAALFMRHPDWAVMFDMDPEMARQTRHRVLDMAVAKGWIVSGFHLPSPAIGRVERRGSGFDFVPLG